MECLHKMCSFIFRTLYGFWYFKSTNGYEIKFLCELLSASRKSSIT